MPLINGEWWSKHYGYVSLGLALPTIWIVGSHDFALILETLSEYLSFIILLYLFVYCWYSGDAYCTGNCFANPHPWTILQA